MNHKDPCIALRDSPRLQGLWPAILAAVLLTGLVIPVFWQVGNFGFVNLDDSEYVYRNQWVLKGLTLEGISWAFTGFRVWNWHPLTLLSHMLDVQFFGANPGPHHLISLLFHLVNTLVLFGFLRSATGATWRSAAVAALFAVHPLHVESVAWVSARKDVLSTLFLLLTLWSYIAYVRTRRPRTYAAALVFFAVGLLSKPMVVTVPFILFLLDWWPLGRLGGVGSQRSRTETLLRLGAEKLPFFALAVAVSIITYLAQASGGGASAFAPFPFWPRVANAIVSYVVYLWKMVWPTSLAAFYPHPATIRPDVLLWPLAGAALILAAVSAWAFRERTKRPYIAWGWLWYLGTLVPVIGLVQVGGQAMADRYTYVPLIGCFVAVVWGLSGQAERWRVPPWAAATVGGAVIVTLAAVAWKQAGYWRDSVTLHERALTVTDRNWKAWQGLCDAKLDLGRYDEAVPACLEAIRILPTFPEAWQTLGVVYARKGEPGTAIPYFRRALELRPDYFNALLNLGSAMGNLGDYHQAISYFREALRLRPDHTDAWAYLGLALLRTGERPGASAAYERLRRLDPARAESLRSRFSQ